VPIRRAQQRRIGIGIRFGTIRGFEQFHAIEARLPAAGPKRFRRLDAKIFIRR
jgi:hypothetical protein